jgi:hypothetical protein
MKTIITTLPIYDKIEKQCYERSKHSGNGIVPIVCPRHRLPSFQWKDDGDGLSDGPWIDLISDQYDGSEESLASTWTVYAGSYDIFNSSGLNINEAKMLNPGDGINAKTDNFDVAVGDIIHIRGVMSGSTGDLPVVFISSDPLFSQIIRNGVQDLEFRSRVAGSVFIEMIASGVMDFSFTEVTITRIKNVMDLNYIMPALPFHYWTEKYLDYFSYNGETLNYLLNPGLYYLRIHTGITARPYLYSEWFRVDCVYGDDVGLPPTATYSEKYLTLTFFNTCDLGDILYHNGFVQTLWFESETIESSFPQEEEGENNGDGRFVRTFARQVKKYLAHTKQMPDYMVDVFNRLKLHDNVELTDLVGDNHKIYNLEVDHEWLFDDKYYAKLDLTFDYNEAIIIGACCENLTSQEIITADNTHITVDSD